MARTAEYVWMDGQIVPWAAATIHVATEAVLRGETVFEGERAYWSEADKQLYIFRHAEHMRRLRQSARIMRMTVPYSEAELTEACVALIRQNGYRSSVHFRPVVYFAEGESNQFAPDEIRTGVFILAFDRPSPPSLATGIKSCVSTWRRNSDLASPSRIKSSGNYHNSRLAHVEARVNGFGTPIMLNDRGKVAESPNSCFMMVRDGVVITPPITADILESITRDTLIKLFRDDLGVQVVERDVDRTELYVCDEAFFCGSGAEVLPIVSVDHYEVGTGKVGPLTKAIQDTYFRVARGEETKYRNWLTPVY
jgi:branched-chain amino acid aminotransferase